MLLSFIFFFFFFNDTATTEIYTLSLHDALPIYRRLTHARDARQAVLQLECRIVAEVDRKSTRLNSSHANISYAVFCLKKKKKSNKAHSVYKTNIVNTTHAQMCTTLRGELCGDLI